MKTFATLLLLMFLANPLLAVDCTPIEVYGGYSAIRCPALYNKQNSRVVFPDNWSALFSPWGTGECEQGSSCDLTENTKLRLAGPTQCWPLFYSPSIGNGSWCRKVQSRQADLQLKYCGVDKATLAGPVVCNNYGTIRVWSVSHLCPGCHLFPAP
jgi:hypothetical protein